MKRSILLMIILIVLMAWTTSQAELVDTGDGTISDTVSGLKWQKGESGSMTWEQALNYCENLGLGGYSDWRLPSRNELQSIVDYMYFSPAIDQTRFPNALSSGYWSSTTSASNADYAWAVNFLLGDVYDFNKSGSYYVRAVRAGQ